MLRRIVRIEPPYLLSVLLVVMLNLIAMRVPGFSGKIQNYPIEQILLHAAYLIPFSQYDWLQPVYWTLAFEFGFYLAVAGLIGLMASPAHWPVWAGLSVLLGAVFCNIASPLLALFAMGFMVFRAHTARDPAWIAGTIIVLAGLVMVWSGARAQGVAGMLTAGLLLTPQLSAGAMGIPGRLLSGLGTISFSLYLIHVPIGGKIINIGQRWVSGPESHLLLSLSALMASLAAACLFWYYVERRSVVASHTLARYWRTASSRPLES